MRRFWSPRQDDAETAVVRLAEALRDYAVARDEFGPEMWIRLQDANNGVIDFSEERRWSPWKRPGSP